MFDPVSYGKVKLINIYVAESAVEVIEGKNETQVEMINFQPLFCFLCLGRLL